MPGTKIFVDLSIDYAFCSPNRMYRQENEKIAFE